MPDDLPSYAELLQRTDAPPGSTWQLFGADSDLGTVALLTPERVAAAAALVRRGDVYRLDLGLDAFDPPLVAHRPPPRHTIISNGRNHRDDFVDGLYLQASTQVDGLRHVRDEEFGFYNGVPDDQIDSATARLGIGVWARHGMAGRGVLVDVDRQVRAVRDAPLDHSAGEPITAALLDETLNAQRVDLGPGAILLIRTGWLHWYRAELDDAGRAELSAQLCCAGLEQSDEMLGWLWDHRVAVVACDNAAVEAMPPSPTSPFRHAASGTDGLRSGMSHPALIARLGLALGELWNLDELATASWHDERYESFVVANPLHFDPAVGSPANAVAIR